MSFFQRQHRQRRQQCLRKPANRVSVCLLSWLFLLSLISELLQDEEGELYVQSPAYLYELMNKKIKIRNIG